MRVRDWWATASERDQDAVLYHTRLDRDLAGVPWAFLPEKAQAVLTRRVRVKNPDGYHGDIPMMDDARYENNEGRP